MEESDPDGKKEKKRKAGRETEVEVHRESGKL